MNKYDIITFNNKVKNTTRWRQIMELNKLIQEETSINEHISITKLCLIGAKRTDVLWIWGNTWSMEGENWEEGSWDNEDWAGLA